MWPPERRDVDAMKKSTVMGVSYGYTDKKKLKMNGLTNSNHKNNRSETGQNDSKHNHINNHHNNNNNNNTIINNCNGHEAHESSDSVSSGDDIQINSHREMSSETSRSSSRDGMLEQNETLTQDGMVVPDRRSSEDGMMLVANGMLRNENVSAAQGELSLQQDGSGRANSRKQRTFIPEVSKDRVYWEKRRKNNEAARRSREKRRQYDQAREESVRDMARQNKYLALQLCIVKRQSNIPVTENIECPRELEEQVKADYQILMAAMASEAGPADNTVLSTGNTSVSRAVQSTSPVSQASNLSNSFLETVQPSASNGPSQTTFHLAKSDLGPISYTLKSESGQQAAHSMPFEGLCMNRIKKEPQEEYQTQGYATSNMAPQSIDDFSNSAEIFQNATSGVNIIRETNDLSMNGQRKFNTSPSSWYPVPMDHPVAAVVVGHHGHLTNGLNLTSHANASTPSPASSSLSPNNYSMTNGHEIPHLPSHLEEDEPLQLTVNKRARQDSDNSSEIPESPEEQWSRNSRNHLSSPTANSNSHRSAHSLPLKLRHKASLPDHTIALTHSLTPTTTMISSNAFSSTSLNHSHTNGLSHLSDVALSQNGPLLQNGSISQNGPLSQNGPCPQNEPPLQNGTLSQNGPLPLLKREGSNEQMFHHRNSHENEVTYLGFSNSNVEDGRMSSGSESLGIGDGCKMSGSNSNQDLNTKTKDPKYLERRRRNNEAARKCRENRKTTHQLHEARSSYFEMQNIQLKAQVAHHREEVGRLKILLQQKQETGMAPLRNSKRQIDNNDDSDNESLDDEKRKKIL